MLKILRCFYFATLICCVFSSPGLAAEKQAQKNVIRISGSGSGLASIRALAIQFEKDNPEIKIVLLPSLGSTGGILALMDNAIDLSVVARPLNSEEKRLAITAVPYASTPIIFATHTSNDVSNLTGAELIDILSGTKKYWQNERYIRLIMRSIRESDYISVMNYSRELEKALVIGTNRNDVIFSSTATDNADMIQSLNDSLGILSFAQFKSEQLNIKALNFENVSPSTSSLLEGDYPFEKSFALVYKNLHFTPAIKTFISYVKSPETCRILNSNGQICKEK